MHHQVGAAAVPQRLQRGQQLRLPQVVGIYEEDVFAPRDVQSRIASAAGIAVLLVDYSDAPVL